MHRVRLFLTFALFFSFTSLIAQTNWEDYQFSDTFQMGNGTFKSTSTVFTDISDSGVIVGYYTTFSNTKAGLVYFKNGKTLVYSHPGYTHTEFWGINKLTVLVD